MRVEVTDGRLRIPHEYLIRDDQLGCYIVAYTFRGRVRTYTISDELYVGDFQFVMAVENGEYIIHPPHPPVPPENPDTPQPFTVNVTNGRLFIPPQYINEGDYGNCYVNIAISGRETTQRRIPAATWEELDHNTTNGCYIELENGTQTVYPPTVPFPPVAQPPNRVDGTYISRLNGRGYWECNRNRMPAIAAHLSQQGRVRVMTEGGNWIECETYWNSNELNFRLYTNLGGTIYYDLIPLNQFRASRNEIVISHNHPLVRSTSSADSISIRRANTDSPLRDVTWRYTRDHLIIRTDGDGEYEVQVEARTSTRDGLNPQGTPQWMPEHGQIFFNMTEVQERLFNAPWPSSPLAPRQPIIERIDKELPRSLNNTMHLGKFRAHYSFPLSASYLKITNGMRIISIEHIGEMIEYTAYSAKFDKTPTPALYEMTIVDGVVKAKQLEETIRKERCLVVTE